MRPLALLLVASVLSVPGVAEAAAPSDGFCQGKRVTLAVDAAPSRTVRGTPRSDVIVVKSAYRVEAGRGADTICLRGPITQVDVGPGDDSVVNERDMRVDVNLDTGSDRFLGGSAPEDVGALGDGDPGDYIATGAGADVVRVSPNARRGSVIDAGPGRDTLYGDGRRAYKAGVTLNNAQRRITVGGRSTGSLRGLEDFYLSGGISFVGGPQSETVIVQGTVRNVNTGDGNDRIVVQPYYLNVLGSLRGGGGQDEFNLRTSNDTGGPISANFASGKVTVKNVTPDSDTQRDATFTVGGMNRIDLQSYSLTVTGRADEEVFRVEACSGTVAGAGGDDDITLTALRNVPDAGGDLACGATDRITLTGGSGNDALGGGELNDVLVGGEGTDTADGGDGIDQCDAEATVRCE